MAYDTAFMSQSSLISKLGVGNAHLVWVLGLLMQESDIESLASEALTDGPNDKKIDFIHINQDTGSIVIAQGYFAESTRDSAPANKASDLNTAIAWLFDGDTSSVPESLRAAIEECRRAILDGEITSIHLFYIHNLPESVNVARELQTVHSNIKTRLGDMPAISIVSKEIGKSQIDQLFRSRDSNIEVVDEILCPSDISFVTSGPHWKAAVLTVPGYWLYDLYARHGEALFSANYRGFLGLSRRKKINVAIRATAEATPEDFWVFNNGITILTNGFRSSREKTLLQGISIINGAQTTGAIGNVDLTQTNIMSVQVLCRIVCCDDEEKVGSIVRYNNTQNEITTWDQYSGNPEQARIQDEFSDLGYRYERKRGFQPCSQSINIEDVAQPLVAFCGKYSDANRGKNRVFERTTLYKLAFDGKKARHILFVYVLSRAIDERRLDLKTKSSSSRHLIEIERAQLELLRDLRFKYFFLSILARVIEPIVGFSVDPKTIAFSPVAANSSNNSLEELIAETVPVVTAILSYVSSQLVPSQLSEAISTDGLVDGMIRAVNALLYTSTTTGMASFESWKAKLSES